MNNPPTGSLELAREALRMLPNPALSALCKYAGVVISYTNRSRMIHVLLTQLEK